MTAQKLKEIVERNRLFLEIPSWASVTDMVLFTREMLAAEGFQDATVCCECLIDRLRHMDIDEIKEQKIWKKGEINNERLEKESN